MASRVPVVILKNLQVGLVGTPTASTAQGSGTWLTISAATAFNTAGAAQTLTYHIVPSGGTVSAANRLGTVTIPTGNVGSTILTGLVAQSLEPGATLVMYSDAATSITVYVSGYATTI